MKIEGVSRKSSNNLTELLKQRNNKGENNLKYWIDEKAYHCIKSDNN